jgi:hypothetical protein
VCVSATRSTHNLDDVWQSRISQIEGYVPPKRLTALARHLPVGAAEGAAVGAALGAAVSSALLLAACSNIAACRCTADAPPAAVW